MHAIVEEDFERGHPARGDYDADSPEAKEWARLHVHPRGERDFPVDHPAAADTPGNKNHIVWQPGVDPFHPELEPFTGRTPKQAAAARRATAAAAAQAQPSPARKPIDGAAFNEALIAERKWLGVDTLNAEQYNAFVERFAPAGAESEQ
jgi:hypothetical protein